MSKKVLTNQGGSRFYINCPACKERHCMDNKTWKYNNDPEKPTFTPSLLVKSVKDNHAGSYRCHSFITDGKIHFCNDCTHELKGKTVDLISFE